MLQNGEHMSGGGIFLAGRWLAVGTPVTVLRDGYVGRLGIFKGKGKNGKLIIDVVGTPFRPVKLHVAIYEIRRVQPTPKATGTVRA